jgi:possible O-methyltransferase
LDKKERISQFIQSFLPERSAFLEKVRKEALSEAVPILREETAALLRVCLKTKDKPKILELGTAVGYSALVMMDAIEGEGEIVTVENFPPRIEKAKENFGASPYKDKICLMEGDGAEILEELLGKKEQFSFIFLDAAKAQYPLWFPSLLKLLSSGGILFCDNILQGELLLESRFYLERRQRTIHKRMREFLRLLQREESLETSILPIGDGVSLSIKKS